MLHISSWSEIPRDVEENNLLPCNQRGDKNLLEFILFLKVGENIAQNIIMTTTKDIGKLSYQNIIAQGDSNPGYLANIQPQYLKSLQNASSLLTQPPSPMCLANDYFCLFFGSIEYGGAGLLLVFTTQKFAILSTCVPGKHNFGCPNSSYDSISLGTIHRSLDYTSN